MSTTSPPVVVFLHGFLESPEIWSDFAANYFDDCQVLLPALPGYDGQPLADEQDYSLEAAAASVRAELERVGAGQAVLVGHSMGGYVALAFAEKYPGLVAGLGLLHSTALPDTDEDLARRQRNRSFIEEHGVAAFAEEFLQPQFAAEHRESMAHHLALLKSLAAAVPQAVALGGIDAMSQRPDRRPVLEKATYPVLFIAGKEDKAVPPEKTHEESLLPDHCTVLWLANVGHLSFVERPADTRRAVRQLVDAAFDR
ncbi:alpha/beta fold hydrolase [Hymenobacter arizonensis]|uniref:Pimeloyl-ACP methyl ester carboxylesterase n=1 Tax=Hymenobacter arizonensis TaxID=1227077 RepID=A0A1I5WWV7_HYMAR|nr:alpha/beta hydrolase [Hymenobacter arizonensis]SFQ24026.1 Pimeloyl-ACP methyl ester carboxylesterase [Hymenobacter arizonensis]